jgi:hypothetical protein
VLKNRFGEFHLRAYNEFFDYFVEHWLENEEIPIFLWSYISLSYQPKPLPQIKLPLSFYVPAHIAHKWDYIPA